MTIPAMTRTVSSRHEIGVRGTAVVPGALLAVLAVGCPIPAGAEDQAATGFELREVIVTARKREESLQQTPVAISAFTGHDLVTPQVSSTPPLTDGTPNLTLTPAPPSSS